MIRRLAALALLCLAWLAATPRAEAALAIDGTDYCTASSAASCVGSSYVYTSNSNDLICAAISTLASSAPVTVTGVTDGSSLTYTKRYGYSANPTGTDYIDNELWCAPWSSSGPDFSITTNFSGTATSAAGVFFAVSGSGEVFDGNAAVPAHAGNSASTTPSVGSVSTSNANDMLLGIVVGDAAAMASMTAGSGYSLVGLSPVTQGSFGIAVEQKIVSATQSGVSVAMGHTTTNWLMAADAIGTGSGGGGSVVPAPYLGFTPGLH